MRTKHSIFFVLTIAAGSIAACTADGSFDLTADTDAGPAPAHDSGGAPAKDASSAPVDATAPDNRGYDSSTGSVDSSIADAAIVDAFTADVRDAATPRDAAADAPVDAAHAADAALPPEGAPCATINEKQREQCGVCGFHERVCLPPDAGGSAVWHSWGFCQNETSGGCVPGTFTSETCGHCGTQRKECQNDCTYAVGSCGGEPQNSCAPGSKDYEPGLSCDAGGRERACKQDCTWTDYGACYMPDGGVVGEGLTISTSPGQTVTGIFSMPLTPRIARMSTGACPKSSAPSDTATSYSFVTVTNPTSQSASVSIWNSRKPNGTVDFDTVLTVYNRASAPTTPAERQQCAMTVNDTCNTSPCPTGQYKWAGIIAGEDGPVIVAPNATIVVYTGMYYGTNTDFGEYSLNVRTESLQ